MYCFIFPFDGGEADVIHEAIARSSLMIATLYIGGHSHALLALRLFSSFGGTAILWNARESVCMCFFRRPVVLSSALYYLCFGEDLVNFECAVK